MPEISIIVPVYNVEQYLCRCVDSILSQTFTDFELILVDDGSPDRCPAICDEFAAKDSRVRVIHKENGGVSSARNTGLRTACGKYVMFCDGDDQVTPDWCQSMLQAIIKEPKAWIASNVWRVDGEGNSKPIDEERNDLNMLPHKCDYFQIYQKGLSAFVCNKIFVLETLISNKIFFDENRFLGEDVEFNTQYYCACQSTVYLPKPLYYYFDTATGAMNKYYPDLFELNLPLFKMRLPLIAQDELEDFCDIYFYHFLKWLENTFDPRNKMSFLKKMQYSQKMMQREEFRFCADHVTGKNDSPRFMRIVRTHNFYLYWLFQKVAQFKTKLFPVPK